MNRLNSLVIANNIVPDEQFGFMPGRSTTYQLLNLTECITSGLELKCSTVATFLNISKAYYSTWHMGLIYKLIQINHPGDLIRVIDSFLAHRWFRVKMDKPVSGWRPMLAGVPQGSTLSPLLYNLYTSDIPRSVRSELSVYADEG